MNTPHIALFTASAALLALPGCSSMQPAPAPPVRPVLTCADCRGLDYYGPQQAPAPDPRVQMASVIAKAVTGVTGIVVGGNVATSIASDLAGSAAGMASTTYVERNATNSTSVSDISASDTVRESSVSNTSVSDTLRDTSVSNTSVTNNTPTTSVGP